MPKQVRRFTWRKINTAGWDEFNLWRHENGESSQVGGVRLLPRPDSGAMRWKPFIFDNTGWKFYLLSCFDTASEAKERLLQRVKQP